MPCYNPQKDYFKRNPNPETGKYSLTFHPKNSNKELAPVETPCGRCIGCRLEYSRQWAVRCIHEAKMHKHNEFITLTYSEENIPNGQTLQYIDFQLFIKRLRKRFGKGIGYFMCGEYGEQTRRPHYHAIIFGLPLPDKLPHSKNESGNTLYISKTLSDLWGKGHCYTGDVTFESAAYVARYVTKKIYGPLSVDHYNGRVPEFARMSTKYAIGKKWLEKYHGDILSTGLIHLKGGKTCGIPRYYKKWLDKNIGDKNALMKIKNINHMENPTVKFENSPERLKVRKAIKKISLERLKRNK